MKRSLDKVLIDDEDAPYLRAAWLDSMGYVSVMHGGKQTRIHRVITQAPDGFDVDHINGNRLDNRRSNLRVCHHADNCKNAALRSDNKTGVKGVWYDAAREKWTSQITTNGKRTVLGRFDSFDEAVAARKAKEREQWREFSRA